MRRTILGSIAILAVTAALAGCGNKSEQASDLSSDSLLASNPVEQPAGDLSPQTDFQPPAEEPPVEAPAPTTPASRPKPKPSTKPAPPVAATPQEEPGVTLPAGTGVNVTVTTALTSETAHVGDTWTGEIKENVIVGDRVVFPAGSPVSGVISGVLPAERGSRAFLVLEVRSVSANGQTHMVSANADSIIAGSTRARNVGAVAGGAAAGALLGKAIGGGGKGALIGGLVGGAAATGAVAKSKGYQALVKEGSVITFNVNESVKIRS